MKYRRFYVSVKSIFCFRMSWSLNQLWYMKLKCASESKTQILGKSNQTLFTLNLRKTPTNMKRHGIYPKSLNFNNHCTNLDSKLSTFSEEKNSWKSLKCTDDMTIFQLWPAKVWDFVLKESFTEGLRFLPFESYCFF